MITTMATSSDQSLENITQSLTPPNVSDDNTAQTPITQQHSNDVDLRKQLFKAAMSREWKKVLELYESNESVRNEKITRAKDTVLHVAVSGARQYIVLKLLQIVQETMSKDEWTNILGSQNKDGDTPLHLAAALGLENVCLKMTEMCPELVTSARNNLNETPLFMAVRHGKKTFFVLETSIHQQQKLTTGADILNIRDTTHSRREGGNSILHYAIKGEHFGLAYEIIHLYPQLVHSVNSNGETALHVLANMPSVFKSGTRFGPFDTIIYKCIITEPLKLELNDFKLKKQHNFPLVILKDELAVVPHIYNTCLDLFSFTKDLIKGTSKIVQSSLQTGICKTFTDEKNTCEENIDEENQYIENQDGVQKGGATKGTKDEKHERRFPPNYDTAFSFFKLVIKLLLIVFRIVSRRVQSIEKEKQKHRHARTIMDELVERSDLWAYDDTGGGMKPAEVLLLLAPPSEYQNQSYLPYLTSEGQLTTSPVLIAAKKGITEMVKKIVDQYPVALWDQDKDEKNIVLLAVEHRQASVYKHMLNVEMMKENIFGKVDKKGNSALHLAAMLSYSQPRSTIEATLQIQREIKWYKYILNSMDKETFPTFNNGGKRAQEMFTENHEELVKAGSTLLTKTSESCSVVAALVATVAFASDSTVPGGVDQVSGFPILGTRPAFQMFAIGSLVALCFSVTSLVLFLAIITSTHKVWDFESRLPLMLSLEITTLFISIASMLVSFGAGEFFIMEKNLGLAAYPIYAVLCFPITFFAIAQFKLYVNLITATIIKKTL